MSTKSLQDIFEFSQEDSQANQRNTLSVNQKKTLLFSSPKEKVLFAASTIVILMSIVAIPFIIVYYIVNFDTAIWIPINAVFAFLFFKLLQTEYRGLSVFREKVNCVKNGSLQQVVMQRSDIQRNETETDFPYVLRIQSFELEFDEKANNAFELNKKYRTYYWACPNGELYEIMSINEV